MPKYFTKLSKSGGQFRLTIPKALIEVLDWEGVEFVILEDHSPGVVLIRRFIDGESLRAEFETSRVKTD